jgi:lactonase
MVQINGRHTLPVAMFLCVCLATGAYAQQGGVPTALVYDAQTRGPVPIPPSERGLQTVVAELWFQVSNEGLVLEGPAFDRDGNLLFCDVSGGRVLRLTPDRRLSTVVSLDRLGPGGLAVHKDGRIFLGFKRSSQHQPALLSATRQMPRQVFAIQASCAACR